MKLYRAGFAYYCPNVNREIIQVDVEECESIDPFIIEKSLEKGWQKSKREAITFLKTKTQNRWQKKQAAINRELKRIGPPKGAQ